MEKFETYQPALTKHSVIKQAFELHLLGVAVEVARQKVKYCAQRFGLSAPATVAQNAKFDRISTRFQKCEQKYLGRILHKRYC